MITENAPAKINLYLHVTGKRADGYHELDSLVVFASAPETSDVITMTEATQYGLSITGPEAGLLNHEDPEKNLITKALRKVAKALGRELQVSVKLMKNLPVASGIGGGSADAGAALRALAKLWQLNESAMPVLLQAAKETGADIPACFINAPCYFGGVGDVITKVEGLPKFYLLLVNPHIPLPTVDVFKARKGDFHPAQRFDGMPKSAEELAAGLKQRFNDLEEPAIGLVDAVGGVIDLIASQHGCLLSRMSGSGATCFGIFADDVSARKAAHHIKEQIREYWVAVSAV
jgi:4-diphosphocytidyl-2-C-methyl-D-erythritol kinase